MGNSNEGVKASWKRGRTRDSIKTIFGQDLGGSKSSSPQELMQELIHVIIRIFRNLFFDFCFQHIPILQGFTNRLVLKFKKKIDQKVGQKGSLTILFVYIKAKFLANPYDQLFDRIFWKVWYLSIRKTLENGNMLGTKIKKIEKFLNDPFQDDKVLDLC